MPVHVRKCHQNGVCVVCLLMACVALAADKGFMAYCLAVYDYAASEPNQLSFSAYDVIGVLNKTGDSQGWWKGYLNGRVRILLDTKNSLNIYLHCTTKNMHQLECHSVERTPLPRPL